MQRFEPRTFDFNLKKQKGLREILYGKGIHFTSIFLLALVALGLILLITPWQMDVRLMMFKAFVIFAAIYFISLYIRAIIKVSFDETNLYVKVWKREIAYALDKIDLVKLTYQPSWGFVRMRIKGKDINKSYSLWAPSYDKDRYDLFLILKDCAERELNKGEGKH